MFKWKQTDREDVLKFFESSLTGEKNYRKKMITSYRAEVAVEKVPSFFLTAKKKDMRTIEACDWTKEHQYIFIR